MKIVLCTTPIRPAPTDFPPFGSLAILQTLRREGWDPFFYDIDGLRPSLAEVEEFFAHFQPDVVGISAVVSTAYAYTKTLVALIKHVSPRAHIVLGGNLAASAEILHRLAAVDYCVIGEGEIIIRNLIRHFANHPGPTPDEAALSRIPGITFLDSQGEMHFTGYEKPLAAAEFSDPDYSILEKHSRIGNFITDPFSRPDFLQDQRTHEPHRRGRKMATLITAKGCVGRCTFCHRWDKGYRAIPAEKLLRQIRDLKERYDVGFLQVSDENFGSDQRQLRAFIAAIKSEDILYNVGGVRVRSVSPQILRDLRDSGCVAVYYGMETGSPDILEMMEKKATQEDNENAARWTREAGLYTIYQLVLGMPGETEKTIQDTTRFLQRATEDLDAPPISRLSVNYIQALPGTAIYEYARQQGLIGRSLREEEQYLLRISDINAADDTRFLNFTAYDYLTVQSWRRQIMLDVIHHYRKKHRSPRPRLRDLILRRARGAGATDDHFNMQRGLLGYEMISAYCYPVGRAVIYAWLILKDFRRNRLSVFCSHLLGHFVTRLKPKPAPIVYKSLRKIMRELQPQPKTPSEVAMAALRDGR